MKNLGKTVLFLLLLTTTSFAKIVANVNPSVVYEGENATYTLNISGSSFHKPNLTDICGNEIISTGSQTSTQLINGHYSKDYILMYEFTPTKSCVIPSVEVEVDGKLEKSNSINLRVKKMKRDPNADFSLTLKTDKKELYVGEPFTVALLVRERKGAEADASKFIAPEFKGFWKKSESRPIRYEESEFITTKILYKLAPQRAGKLVVEKAKLKIATRVGGNNWGRLIPQVHWKTYSSNNIEISAKALPNNVKIVGDFTISARVEKREVHANEAVNLIVEVQGNGNLEDIESFKPYIVGVNVFDEKIELQQNRLHQKLVFVGDKDFTIPAFELIYFDIETEQVRKIETEPIKIKVNGSLKTTPVLKVKRDTNATQSGVKVEPSTKEVVVEKYNYFYISFAFLSGLLIGIVLMLFQPKLRQSRSKKFDIRDEKLLLVKLLPYKDNDKDVAEVVQILEENIYSKSKETLDKKLLKELLHRYSLI